MSLLDAIHEQHVLGRRAQVLSQHLARALPAKARVLDVGCGDGEVAWLIGRLRPDVRIQGVDVLVRDETRIPVETFDGRVLPFEEDRFDAVMLVDVLHHCEQPMELLSEVRRVAHRAIVIKDHTQQGFLANETLRLMDWVGNRRYGVALPYNYWSQEQWHRAFQEHDVDIDFWTDRLNLYPWPASLLFDRSLHFVTRLTVKSRQQTEHDNERFRQTVQA